MREVARIVLEQWSEGPLSPHSSIAGDLHRFLDFFDDAPMAAEGECTPPIDVTEHADRIEITIDVPGVPASALRVIYARGAVVIAGRKLPRSCDPGVTFHLAERGFGRFVRAVGLSGAFDAGRASASLNAGELRVVLPRIEERRGREIAIEISAR